MVSFISEHFVQTDRSHDIFQHTGKQKLYSALFLNRMILWLDFKLNEPDHID